MHLSHVSAAAVAASLLAGPGLAEEFRKVEDKDHFVSLVSGRELTRLGISLNVTPAGRIEGRAFGRQVTGAWRWADGYFCRDLFFGSEDLGPNCQVVEVKGATIRFIADRGAGDHADLRLR
ncbi:dihydrodipicolinate reductase [Ostreiculturibacter nitratireducens]|uniref:dihydrodipicolinate reductase n=1 Tax=Ostreiculturibacter nitratireducens TaxID=3075226 RepID=UPI0031B5712A